MTLIGRQRCVALSIVTTLATLQHVTCYNVDTQVPVVKSGPTNSAFGLQVVPFVDDNNTPLLVVGAPLAESATLGHKTGAVFTCEVLKDDCNEIPGLSDQSKDANGTVLQLLGQTVAVTKLKRGVRATVCAPLFKDFVTGTYLPIGQCFTLDGKLESPFAFYPLYDIGRDAGKKSYRMFMGGQSAVLDKFLAIGAPGAFKREGTLIRTDPTDTAATSHYDPPTDDLDQETYTGYSLGIGNVTSSSSNYVTGQPRGNGMTGIAMVLRVTDGGEIDSHDDRIIKFNGDQIGSFFGHTICVVDLNADGADDVIVGAPYYASQGGTQGRNNGRIYIYSVKPKDLLKRDGESADGYFGMAVAAIGDINRDDYQDIAVGAPGELQGQGRVYIYLGNKDTYISDVAQTIDGSSVSEFTPKFFGYTLSGGVDMDNNSYPDLIVGSYASDRVWILRSRPIIKVYATITFMPESIDVEKHQCTTWSFSSSGVACFKVKIVMWYESKVANVKPPKTADIGYNLTLDFNHPSQFRLRFVDNNHFHSDTVQLTHGSETELLLDIYVTPTIKDKESNFDVKFLYYSPMMTPEAKVTGRLQKLFPMVDNDELKREQIVNSRLRVVKLCADNTVCHPHLVTTASVAYINNGSNLGNVDFIAAKGYGKYDRPFLKLHIAVENRGESAYKAGVIVTLPDKLRFKQATTTDGSGVTCRLREKIHADYVGVSHVDCSIGNPVFNNEKKEVDFYLTNLFVGNEGQLEIIVNATSNGDEHDRGNDRAQLVPFNVKAYSVLTGSGSFFPRETIEYKTNVNALNESADPLENLGPRVLHMYNITNNGPSTIEDLRISITWPMQDSNGMDLLYLYAVEILGDKTYSCDDTYIDLHGKVTNSTQHRRKRSVPDSYRSTDAVGCREDENICVAINCTLNSSLPANGDVKIILYSRVVARTVAKYTETAPTAASRLIAWFDSRYFYKPTVFSATVRSRLKPDQVEEYFDCVPVWVVIGSVIGGVVILAIIILILCYCGFFKIKHHGSMTVSAARDIQWRTANPTSQAPAGSLATETVTNDQHGKNDVQPRYENNPMHEREHKDDKPPYENYPLHEREALKSGRKSESEESDDSVKKAPMNGDEQTTV